MSAPMAWRPSKPEEQTSALTTVTLLADALALEGIDRAALLAAASPDHDLTGPLHTARVIGPRSNVGVLLADAVIDPMGGWRHPFIGRSQVLENLDATRLAGTRVVVLSGDAGEEKRASPASSPDGHAPKVS